MWSHYWFQERLKTLEYEVHKLKRWKKKEKRQEKEIINLKTNKQIWKHRIANDKFKYELVQLISSCYTQTYFNRYRLLYPKISTQ